MPRKQVQQPIHPALNPRGDTGPFASGQKRLERRRMERLFDINRKKLLRHHTV
jgi:hypothetical protein